MTLLTQFLTVRRDRLLMRLGCWLVIFSLIVGLMLPQQRAYAVEPLTMTAVAGLAAAYLGACGLTVVVSGMDKDALVSSVQRLIQEFLDTELGGMTIQDWLGSVWEVAVLAGKIMMGRSLTDQFATFAQWVAQKYGTQVGQNVIYSEKVFYLADGTRIVMGTMVGNSIAGVPSNATKFYLEEVYQLSNGNQFGIVTQNNYLYQYSVYGGQAYRTAMSNPVGADSYYLIYKSSDSAVWPVYYDGTSFNKFYYGWSHIVFSNVVSSLSIDRALSMSYIPEDIAADQGIALDVGAAATMDLDLVLQGVLDKVLAGTLTSTMEAAGEIDVPVDPPAGEITDVDGLGLPALGAALTSRFPFSIPWDFMRAVQLLAAPAKAPYFEVDFLKPMEHRVGSWQGSTKIVLDFSQYAIIGQVSRWTSTIGFCLMLASATKRLIWTA